MIQSLPRLLRGPLPSPPPGGGSAREVLVATPAPSAPVEATTGPARAPTGPAALRESADRARDYRAVTTLFCAFVALEAVTAAVLFVMKLGLSPGAIASAYAGSAMRAPRSLAGLLEVAVPHLLALPLTVFTLVHLVAWLRPERGARVRRMASITFAVLFVVLAAGFGVRFLWPGLSWLKLAAFLGFEGLLAGWLWAVLRAFAYPRAAR